jgi:hypothetical protein
LGEEWASSRSDRSRAFFGLWRTFGTNDRILSVFNTEFGIVFVFQLLLSSSVHRVFKIKEMLGSHTESSMKRITVTIILFLSLSITNAQQRSLIGHFQSTDTIETVLDGCACRLSSTQHDSAYVFISTMDGKTAWMNIAGTTIRLRLSNSDESDIRRQSFTRKYKAHGLSVSVHIERSPTPRDLQSESDGFYVNVTLTVHKGSKMQTIYALGLCAC